MEIRSRDQLIDFINYGNEVKYVFFWGHQKTTNIISKSCFSQWYESPFESDGNQFQTAEHFMMYHKAMLFGDTSTASQVLAADNPGKAKSFGRMVQGFNESKWLEHRFEIVVKANLAKFSSHPDLKAFLLNTADRVLVEASPVDKIWGVGLAMDNPVIENPNLWKGLNLLGFALMDVRDQLSRDTIK